MYWVRSMLCQQIWSDNLTLNTLGGEITANISGGASLTDGNSRTCNIITVDVQANNGILHIIDRVILPFLRALEKLWFYFRLKRNI